jgi:hypothetical protein
MPNDSPLNLLRKTLNFKEMKTKKPILRLVALAALSFFTGNEIVAQTSLGAECGCPSVTGRPEKLITLANGKTWTTLPAAAYGKELLQNQNVILSCDTTWLLNEKLYVGPGSTLTIQPGTVIKGGVAQNVAAATALIIERGGKINAPGVKECPIVFTAAADPLTGAYSVNNKGMWGGVLICGTAKNNLSLTLNGPFIPGQQGKIAVANGLGVLEGFASSYPQDQFGVNLSGATGYTPATSPSSATYTFDLAIASSQGTTSGVANGSIGSFNLKVGQTGGAGTSASNLAAFALVGTAVSGTGIPSNTTVTGVSSDVITFNNAFTVAASGLYTFTNTYPQAPSTSGQFFAVTSTPTFANNTYGPFNVSGGLLNFAAPYIGTPGYTTWNDDDNSGVMKYVSIRHAGANLLVGSEINGLTLASVGRGTTIENIEIVSCADDNIEIFGGTVNLKYCTTLYGNDDMYDYDLGWTGNAQFLFGMKANQFTIGTTPSGISPDNDNGIEADGGDGGQNVDPSNPSIYNVTIIGNAKIQGTADNRGLAAMNFKDGARGTVNNSVFAGFKNGMNIESSTSTFNPNSSQNYASGALKVKCNTFVGVTSPAIRGASTLDANGTGFTGTDSTTFYVTDKNLKLVDALSSGFDFAFAVDPSNNSITTKNDVVPNNVPSFQLGTGCPQAPMNGFFIPVNYRGAFKPGVGNDNWLSDWSYSQLLNSTKGLNACPADINNDGVVGIADFQIFAPAYGNSCN